MYNYCDRTVQERSHEHFFINFDVVARIGFVRIISFSSIVLRHLLHSCLVGVVGVVGLVLGDKREKFPEHLASELGVFGCRRVCEPGPRQRQVNLGGCM